MTASTRLAGLLLARLRFPTLGAGPDVGAGLSERWDLLTAHVSGQVLRTHTKNLGFFGGLILEGLDRWAVRPVGEVFLASASGPPHTTSGLLGDIWWVSDTLCLDAALRAARRGGLGDYEIRVGLTWDPRVWSMA